MNNFPSMSPSCLSHITLQIYDSNVCNLILSVVFVTRPFIMYTLPTHRSSEQLLLPSLFAFNTSSILLVPSKIITTIKVLFC